MLDWVVCWLFATIFFGIFSMICVKKNFNDILTGGSIVIFFILLITVLFLFVGHFENTNQAKFINEQFHTTYTAKDLFWNGDNIKELTIGKRININK